jgi:hypothetical protein
MYEQTSQQRKPGKDSLRKVRSYRFWNGVSETNKPSLPEPKRKGMKMVDKVSTTDLLVKIIIT